MKLSKLIKLGGRAILATTMLLGFFSCHMNMDAGIGDSEKVGEDSEITAANGESAKQDGQDNLDPKFAAFYNYPTGKESTSGLLTVSNQLTKEEVLLFDGTVEGKNYIGTIPPSSSISVKLDAEKFHTVIGVCKSAYIEKGERAAQYSVLTYYSSTQSYKISVSPDNLSGGGTWIFNNYTKYWVSVESVSCDGTTYAVIQPNALCVTVPVQLNRAYDYKIVYKKELKYRDTVVAVSDVSVQNQNDTLYLSEDTSLSFTTNFTGVSESLSKNLDPAVYFINSCGKSVRVYNGQVQLSNVSDSSADDFVILAGTSALLTGLAENQSTSSLSVSSVAWLGKKVCKQGLEMKKGKVYIVGISTSSSNYANIAWTVQEVSAEAFYDEQVSDDCDTSSNNSTGNQNTTTQTNQPEQKSDTPQTNTFAQVTKAIKNLDNSQKSYYTFTVKGNCANGELETLLSAIKRKDKILFYVDLSDVTGVTEIDSDTGFSNLDNLVQVSLPNSVRRINDSYALGNCIELKNVTLPKNLEYLGNRTFGSSSKLKSIVIPASVSKMGYSPFEYCSALYSVEFEKSDGWKDSEDNDMDFSDAEENATYFKTLPQYGSNSWINKND